MKHQALSRVISAVLAVMCLVTLISGVAGFVSAGKDFSQDRSDYKTLRDRIAEAESLDAQLNCGKDEYDKTAAELKAEKGQYDDDASRHREELTEYTATNAGLQMGSGSIGSAASTLEEGWKQYNAAREQFDAMEAEFNVGYNKYLPLRNVAQRAEVCPLPLFFSSSSAVLRWRTYRSFSSSFFSFGGS